MKATQQPDTEELLDRAGTGDRTARQQLLARHRGRLRQMVALRIDRRMAARIDPSDVVQEALADAAQSLSEYLENRPLPFYPWLRQFAWERLLQLHRFHFQAQRRSVNREQLRIFDLAGDSEAVLAERLVNSGSSPSGRLLRAELRERVQAALESLEPRDREVLVLRYLEQLTSKEIAAVLGISEAAVKTRHRRALERLRARLDIEPGEAMRMTTSMQPLGSRPAVDDRESRPRRRARGSGEPAASGRAGGLRGDPGQVSRACRVAAPAAAGGRGDGRVRRLRQPAGGGGCAAGRGAPRDRAGRAWATSASSARSAAAAWGSSTRPSRCRWAAGWR